MQVLFKRFLIVAGSMIAAILIGTLGFVWIEGWPVFDSFYMTMITLTTVGYGEIHPLSTTGRAFASFLMLVGVTSVFISIAVLGESLLRLELSHYFETKRRNRMLDKDRKSTRLNSSHRT